MIKHLPASTQEKFVKKITCASLSKPEPVKIGGNWQGRRAVVEYQDIGNRLNLSPDKTRTDLFLRALPP
jgi:hypothetical protein